MKNHQHEGHGAASESPRRGAGEAFSVAIDRLLLAASSAVLTDGVRSCSYGEMPGLFAALDEFFRARNIERGHRLAFECSRSTFGAVTLLYLFSRGYDFLLAPAVGPRYQIPEGAQRSPGFCRYRLTIDASEDADTLESPETFLNIEENPDRTSGSATERVDPARLGRDRLGPRLYLRTSGSTAAPKIAVHSHQRMMHNALGCVHRLELSAADRIAIPVPLFHMYGLGAAFLPGFLAGASIDLLQGNVNILTYMERERRFDPTVAFLTPALCGMFVSVRRSKRPYRLAVTAGDRLPEGTLEAFEPRFGTLINLYGSTELGAIATTLPGTPAAERGASVGALLPGVEARVAAAGTDLSDDQVGELHCRHRHGFCGYVDQDGDLWDDGSEPRLDGEGWFRTGDLAKMPAGGNSPSVPLRGNLEILGRCDLSVNRDGLLVPFADVEAAISRLDGIEQAGIASHGQGRRGQRIVAFCVLAEGTSDTAEEVRRRCFGLPAHMIPDEVVIIDAMPILPNGKMDRRNLSNAARSLGRPEGEQTQLRPEGGQPQPPPGGGRQATAAGTNP